MKGKMVRARALAWLVVVVCSVSFGETRASSGADSFLRFLQAQGYSRPNAALWPTMFIKAGRLFFLDRDRQMQPINLNPADGKITVGNQGFFSNYVDNSVLNYFRWLKTVLSPSQWQQLRDVLATRAPQFWARIFPSVPTVTPLPTPNPFRTGLIPTSPEALARIPRYDPNHGLAPSNPNPERPNANGDLLNVGSLFTSSEAGAPITCRDSTGQNQIGRLHLKRRADINGFEVVVYPQELSGAPLPQRNHISNDGAVFQQVFRSFPNPDPNNTGHLALEIKRNPATHNLQITEISRTQRNGVYTTTDINVCDVGPITELGRR